MDLLDRLLGHDAWTTQQLLLRCRALTDEQLDREFDIGHRTVRSTLQHIVANIEIWTRLNRGASGLASLARAVSERNAWDERWLDVLENPPVEKTYGAGIAHIITHSMHHRAQVLYMLRGLGLEDLPEGDVLTWERQLA
jgi:uncharacterized damage-inducible protein DinB